MLTVACRQVGTPARIIVEDEIRGEEKAEMAKVADRRRKVYFCRECGHESAKWMGFCPSPHCDSTRPMVEGTQAPAESTSKSRRAGWTGLSSAVATSLADVSVASQPRVSLPSPELNRVLGGGIVPGSVSLLTGEPGVGKSTLLLQLANSLSTTTDSSSEAQETGPVLYVTGEESPVQIKLRADRMGVNGQGILLLAETDVDLILERLDETKPALAIVDSIQTLQSESETSGPGSVGQVRESALRLLRWAKTAGRPVFLSGHMTKDGALAGPRVLEHMVDVVLHLESQESGGFRVLRAAKNRFGSTDEVGVFQMTERGMADVSDPSRAMLSQKDGPQLGAIVTPVLEGSRALLLEVQALTNFSQLPAPRRVANGVDHNRLLMLTAVASRRTGLELGGQDVIVNVAGGFRATEPAADLAIILAIASCYRNAPLPPAAAFGEVGLSAELRAVPQAQRRVNEAARLGLTRCILPSACLPEVEAPPGMRLTGAETVGHAIRAALTSPADDADLVLAGGRARAVSAASSR